MLCIFFHWQTSETGARCSLLLLPYLPFLAVHSVSMNLSWCAFTDMKVLVPDSSFDFHSLPLHGLIRTSLKSQMEGSKMTEAAKGSWNFLPSGFRCR